MILNLYRTFSRLKNADLDEQGDCDDWLRYLNSSKAEITWDNLLKNPVVVVLGEAGIGKTTEFKKQVECLDTNATAAFFVPLDQIIDKDSFSLELGDSMSYELWKSSDKRGFFFLDAIDESRLNNPAQFVRALKLILSELRPFLTRLTFILSSRITDWGAPGVKEAVECNLLEPLTQSLLTDLSLAAGDSTQQLYEGKKTAEIHQIAVFCMDPLSAHEAKRFAAACGVADVEAFWTAVEQGGYEFMATRPMDLEWMAQLWTKENRLGSYSELIDFAISKRLEEINQRHSLSHAALSPAQLWEGAEQLAAACVFSGRPYVSTRGHSTSDNEVSADVLSNWTFMQYKRLLGTALFDEAAFGQVKFHHRAFREYLAACWLFHRIQAGLPLHHVMPLFISSPYGHRAVLVSSRRATLCWLMALSAEVRESVIRQYPEMLMFDGDPERWSTDDVAEALDGLIVKIDAGYRPDWRNWSKDESKLRRVAIKLPHGMLAERLEQHVDKTEVVHLLLRLIRYGRLKDCADAVFKIYRTTQSDPSIQQPALLTLAVTATDDQRQQVQLDLIARKLNTNKTKAAALTVIQLSKIDVPNLVAVFKSVDAENDFIYRPMANSILHIILPSISRPAADSLLEALLKALPDFDRQRIGRFSDSGEHREAWILDVLPDCLLRVLELLPENSVDIPDTYIEAALLLDQIRGSGFIDDYEVKLLRAAVTRLPVFQKQLTLAIAENMNPTESTLEWSYHGLVPFSDNVIDCLTEKANALDAPPAIQDACYRIARDSAFSHLSGDHQQKVLHALKTGANGKARSREIQSMLERRTADLHQQNDRRQKGIEAAEQQLAQRRRALQPVISGIRDGSARTEIKLLLDHAYRNSNYGYGSLNRYTHVNIDVVERDFGPEIASALSDGLQAAWQQTNILIPEPTSNVLPIEFEIGLAGLNQFFSRGVTISSMPLNELEKAAKLGVWAVDCEWFHNLAVVRPDDVAQALWPWFETELKSPILEDEKLRTFNQVMLCPDSVRCPLLERARLLLDAKQIVCGHIERQLLGALVSDNLIGNVDLERVVSQHLSGAMNTANIDTEQDWLKAWASWDPNSSWKWLESHVDQLGSNWETFLTGYADKFNVEKWLGLITSKPESIDTLFGMYKFLCMAGDGITGHDGNLSKHPIERIRSNILKIFVRTPGKKANDALCKFLETYSTASVGRGLEKCLLDHTGADAEKLAILTPADLFKLGNVYCDDPGTEGDLFKQVLARLEEIKLGVENGPFSDRVLFEVGMLEKKLQIWLAARLRDTPLRRFIPRYQVEREGEQDNNKRTDIQISSAAGKVCIEVKPLGGATHYSPGSLVSTLQDQIVGQYLGGYSSAHGILVIFLLGGDKWDLPNGQKSVGFKGLLDFLENEAKRIKAEHPKVTELQVFGIDCRAPS